MGMGEPLLNYDTLIKAIHILRDRNGLDFPTDGITISTVGPLKELKKLREEHIKIQLTLSLHATTQAVRDRLIPNMKGQDIGKLWNRYYHIRKGIIERLRLHICLSLV